MQPTRRWVWAFVVLLLALLTGCAQVSAEGRSEASGTGVVRYGVAVGQEVDVRQPAHVGPQTDSVILIHGGGWHWGDRKDYAWMTDWLASKGFLVYNMNYRLGEWPHYLTLSSKLEDIGLVVALAQRRAIDLGASGRIGLSGGSAGGHLSLVYAYGPGRGQIWRVVDINGPTDLLNPLYRTNGLQDPIVSLVGQPLGPSTEDAYRAASPFYQVQGGEAPTLMIHGDADPTVDFQDSVRLDARLEAVGVAHKLIPLKGKNHGDNWGPPEWSLVSEQTLAWFSAP